MKVHQQGHDLEEIFVVAGSWHLQASKDNEAEVPIHIWQSFLVAGISFINPAANLDHALDVIRS